MERAHLYVLVNASMHAGERRVIILGLMVNVTFFLGYLFVVTSMAWVFFFTAYGMIGMVRIHVASQGLLLLLLLLLLAAAAGCCCWLLLLTDGTYAGQFPYRLVDEVAEVFACRARAGARVALWRAVALNVGRAHDFQQPLCVHHRSNRHRVHEGALALRDP